MRPIKLTVQAFGPFAGRVDMDFRALDGAPLYGIYGPTGGGKTSILDAICYALFGESSGGDRSAEHLRSDFADPATPTFVELIFKVGERRFLIRRAPIQEIAKKRGTGLTQRSQEAYLFDVSGLAVDDVAYPDNPGTVLAEKKVGEVKEAVGELLGYESSQFRQVVVLPQGRFRELLTAKSDDRSTILRKLFETAVYARLTLRLKEERSAIRANLERSKEAMKTILDGVQAETVEELAAAIEEKTGEIATAEKKVRESEAEARKADEALHQGRQLDERFRELDTARAAVGDFTARAKQVDGQKAILETAVAALRIAPAADTADSAAAALRESMEDLEAKNSGARDADAALARAAQAFAESEAEEPRREARRRHRADLQRFLDTWSDLADKRGQLAELSKTAAAADAAFASAERATKDAEAQLNKAILAEENVVKAQADKAVLERDLDRLEAENKAREELATTRKTLAETERALGTATREQDAAHEAAVAARQAREAAETAYLSSTAATLASALVPGDPCPVCGATDHPSPAGPGAKVVSRDEVNAARTALDDADSRFNDTRDRVVKLASDLKMLQARAGELSASQGTGDLFADTPRDLTGPRKALNAAASLVETEGAVRGGRAAAAAALEAARQTLETARETRSRSKEELTRLEAELKTALRDVPETLRGQEALAAALERAETKLADALAGHEAARTRHQAAAAARDTQAALARAAEQSVAKERTRMERERSAFQEAMKRGGFESEAVFRAARRSEEEIATLSTHIEDFDKEKAAAEDRLVRAKTGVEGKERPDPAALETAQSAAKAALEDARARKTTLESDLRHLSDAGRRYAEKAEEHADLDIRHREAARLNEVADGRGANLKRIPLVEYVLQTYFDDVLGQANQRFQPMSRNRYVLRRKQGPSSGNRTTGLDITVFDTYTDQERDAATLSGGEGFLAALSLALGLSDVVQAEAGGIRLDAIFIDEGFGHLDEEALDTALETLEDLSGKSRSVGIISHVEEVKRRLPVGFDVVRAPRGSEIRVRSGG